MNRSPIKRNQTQLKRTPLRKQSIKSVQSAKEKQEERKELRIKDQKFYLKIWKDRGHRSDITGNYLGNFAEEDVPSLLFHHLLPKETYPQFRHCDWNICMCEGKYHSQIETNANLLPEEIFDRFIELLNNAKNKAGLN